MNASEINITSRPLSEFEPKKIDWLWSGRIPIGCITLLEGDGGTGKSYVAAALASALSNGSKLPDDDSDRSPQRVLLLAAEDDPSVVLRPRCEALGADLSKVFFCESQFVLDAIGIEKLRGLIVDTKPILVVIDPIVSFLGTKIDTSKATDVRSVMAPIAELASEFGLSVLIVRHWNKSFQAAASMRGSGSVDFRNSARSSLQVIRNGNDHYLTLEKSNYGATGKTLGFKIEDSALIWTEPSGLNADDLLENMRGIRPEKSREDAAMEFLKAFLASGARPAAELIEAAKNAGLSERTLARAKQNLGIESCKTPNGWDWRIANSSEF